MPKEYICISTEPDSLLDGEGEPYEVFGNSFTASEGERPTCLNTQSDGKHIYFDTSNPDYSVEIYIGETQILSDSFTASSGGGTETGSVSVNPNQFNQCWILLVADGGTQGCIFEPEELESNNTVGFKVVASHNGSQLRFDLVRKTGV